VRLYTSVPIQTVVCTGDHTNKPKVLPEVPDFSRTYNVRTDGTQLAEEAIQKPDSQRTPMKRTSVALALAFLVLWSVPGFAQSIGPDGSVLPVTGSGPIAKPSIAKAPVAKPSVVNPPAVQPTYVRPTVVQPTVAKAMLAGTSVPPSNATNSHVLNESEVAAAVEQGYRQKPRTIGLTLIDVQTALLSGMVCTTCGQSGYAVVIYTPSRWIEYQASEAKRQLRPFSVAYVTPEMRQPILRVVAMPSKADYITGRGLSLSSSVSRVVLTDKTKQTIIQPLTNEQGNVESNSAYRSVNYTSASASFWLSDVDTIRGEDDKGEFFVVVVGTNQNKYFKVKTRMFKALF
jgi:hypothetical protein